MIAQRGYRRGSGNSVGKLPLDYAAPNDVVVEEETRVAH